MEQEMFFSKNSELSIEFSKYVLDHPEMDDHLSDETIVVFLPEFDPELKQFNLKMAQQIESKGGSAFYVKVRQLAGKASPRLIGVEVANDFQQAVHS